MLHKSVRRFSSLLKESYVPDKLPAFTNGSFKVYECRAETKGFAKYTYYPMPFIGALGGYMAYKTVYWTGMLPVFLPTFPLAILMSIRKNVLENCETSIETIELMMDGK